MFPLAYLLSLASLMDFQEQGQLPVPAAVGASQETMADAFGDDELGDLSLADLLDIEVISVSRTPRSVSHSPAAIHVISREEIRRSGHLNLPELLRGVPGLHVARINGSQWSVSARGPGGRFSDKLQVMIDGRIIYNSLFSGVFWGDQDLLLDDIERIEVVRGPGGVLWGSNAVNGVINIITRSAKENHDPYYSVLSGNRDRTQVAIRQGGQLDPEGAGWWRAFAKWTQREPSPAEAGVVESEFHDTSRTGRVGLRMDWDLDDDTSYMLQSGFGHLRLDQVDTFLDLNTFSARRIKSDGELNTGFLMGRWTHDPSKRKGSSLLGYVDVDSFNSQAFGYESRYATLDYQNHSEPWNDHVITWGGGYRYAEIRVDKGQSIFATRHGQRNHILTAFVQDEWQVSDDWSMILGSRFEQRRLGGFSVQPNARLLWAPEDAPRSAWAAVSRALRAPSFREDDLSLPASIIPGAPPTLLSFEGNKDFESEELLAFEIGYREQASEGISIDLTAYYFDYDNQRSQEPIGPAVTGGVLDLLALATTNNAEGNSYGFEASLKFHPRSDWRLSATASWIEIDVPSGKGSIIVETNRSDDTPKYMASLVSSHDLSDTLNLDLALHGVSGTVDSLRYLRADLRLGWQVTDKWNMSFVLQDAFEPRHTEGHTDFLTTVAEIERAAYLRLVWSP